MARGWESKSVEEQIDMAEPRRRKRSVPLKPQAVDPLDLIRKRESLQLSRTRVVQEMNAAQNPRYRELLGKALADLEANLAKL
ncbi:MAG: hypothetical protein ABSG03_26955 [Bryobacteraceae bacterium]|jgi:hypothetical protein